MIRRLRLIRDRNLTLSTFLDELLPITGNRLVSREVELLSDGGFREREQRFGELHREVCAMSRFLVEEAGLERGGRVAIWKANDARCFRWFLAAIRAGGVAVPMNPLLAPAEAQSILERCNASVLVTDAAQVAGCGALPVKRCVLGEGEPPLPGFQHFTRDWLDAPPIAPVQVGPDETIAVFHSSGTEGSPKIAMLSSRALLAGRAMAVIATPLAGIGAMALLALPWAHIMAVSTAIYGLLAGIPACLLRRFDVEAAVAAIERNRVTSVVGVPAMFIRLVNAAPPPASLKSVRLWVSASDQLPDAYRRRLLQYGALAGGPGGFRIGPLFINAYGMVEIGGCAMFGLDAPFLPGNGELCLPVPPFQVRVVDGECQVRGPGVTGRYWGESDDGAAHLAPGGWLRTGDLAVRTRLGFVRLTGRAKDVIKSGGYSISASEVEAALLGHAAVARAAVIGIPHPGKGEVPVAVVEVRPGPQPDEEELLAWCRQRMAAYKVPRRVHFAEAGSLPQGATEKILKRRLREQYGK